MLRSSKWLNWFKIKSFQQYPSRHKVTRRKNHLKIYVGFVRYFWPKHHVTLTNGSEMAQNSLINPFLNLLKGTLSSTILISSLNLFFLSPINYGSKKLILSVSVLKTNSQKWTNHWNKIAKEKLEPGEFWRIKNKIRHVRFSVSCIR